MATSSENNISMNCIVHSKENNAYCCLICTRDYHFTKWDAHLVTKLHVKTRKQFNLIFVQIGNKVNCKACGGKFVWDSFKEHAYWHKILPWYEPEDKDKILFDNHILVWKMMKTFYYCFPCNELFFEWFDIYTHFADDKHENFIKKKPLINPCFSLANTTVSYELLISEGFEPSGPSQVKCTICNFSNIEFENITQHIESVHHLSRKFELQQKLRILETEQIMESLTGKTIENLVNEEIRNDEQINASCDSSKYSNNNQINTAHTFLTGSLNRGRSASPRGKGQNINQKFRRNFSTGRHMGMNNHREINTTNDSSRNSIKQNHTIKPRSSDSLINFPIQQRGTERYCTICELIVNTTDEYHFAEDKHLSSLRCYGYEHIAPQDGIKFHCKSCNCVIPNLENVYRHIKGIRHRNLLSSKKDVTNRQDGLRGKTTSFKMNFPKPAENLTKSCWGSLPPRYIVTQSTGDLFCRICNCVIHGHNNANDHIRGRIHANAIEQFCATINNTGNNLYYCKRCNCQILGHENLYLHVNASEHANHVLATRELPARNLDSVSETLKQPENTSKTIENYEFIIKLNNIDFCCKICHRLFNQTTIDQHVTEQCHELASKNYNWRDPSSSENVKYFCTSCRCNIPNLANVYLHTVGGRHKNSLNLPNNSTLGSSMRSHFGPNREILARDYISQISDTDYNCKICNVCLSGQSSVNAHIADESHIAACKKYGCQNISHIDRNKYECKLCDCVIPTLDNLYVHVAGKKHLQIVSEKHQTMPIINNTPDVAKIPKLLELKTFPPSSLAYLSQQKSEINKSNDLANDQISPKERQIDTGEQTLRKLFSASSTIEPQISSSGNSDEQFPGLDRFEKVIEKMVAEAIERDRIARSTTNSVINTRQSNFSTNGRTISSQNSDNGLSLNDDSPHRNNTNDSSSAMKLAEVKSLKLSNETFHTLHDDGKSFRSLASSTLSLNENGKPVRKRRAPKTPSIQSKDEIFDFDNDYIYDMKDKLKEIEDGMKLCLTTDSNNIYCLICHKKTANTLHNYCEHLCSLDHCDFLESMEKDHSLFEVVPGQFSELHLSSHYMEESSEDIVLCHVCEQEINNVDHLLQNHINDRMHVEKCEEMRTKGRENFEFIRLRILCDWYKIYKYWCVPCSMTFDSELTFVKHLKSSGHSSVVNKDENTEKKMIYDFCSSCALLWYGYRYTYVNHSVIPTHKWLIRDENYLSPQLPTSAKCLLAMPEEYIQDTMKYLDETLAKEREKHEMLIHDIENAVKCEFPDVKAYPFGSRVSGLDSINSGIDIFLDCGNMYDGKNSSQERISYIRSVISDALSKDPQSWDMEELLTKCQSSTIKTRHRATGLACDIHFENGIAVESTKLIKTYNDVFPSCRKMIIFLKQWLEFCDLPISEFITINALCWCVIFYLQHVSIVPNIAELIEIKEEPHIIAGWEVGVSHDFTCILLKSGLTIKELLIRFFTFYANFDYRYNVVCPLIGEPVKKRVFANPQKLPKEMKHYIEYMKNSNNPKSFKFDAEMCIQDPFFLQKNLTEAVSKVNLSHFRTYCFKSLDILDGPASQ